MQLSGRALSCLPGVAAQMVFVLLASLHSHPSCTEVLGLRTQRQAPASFLCQSFSDTLLHASALPAPDSPGSQGTASTCCVPYSPSLPAWTTHLHLLSPPRSCMPSTGVTLSVVTFLAPSLASCETKTKQQKCFLIRPCGALTVFHCNGLLVCFSFH